MFEIGGVSILLAFVAGLFSVLSPCVLPLVPVYLGYLTGTALEATPTTVAVSNASGSAVAVAGSPPPRVSAPSPFMHSVAFVGGFSTVFVAFGISIGLVGYVLQDNQDLILKASGTALIVMGLHLSGVITIPFLEQERRLDVGRGAKISLARSFMVGSAFSAGWSPCMGPTLGAIFALSVDSGTVAAGGVLLLIYSAGLAIPFLTMGLAYNSVKPVYTRIKRYVGVINYFSGALLVIIGILIFTNSLTNLNEAFNFGFLSDISQDT